jgi:anti-sigma regulatory factor (Ser/Thr protein kinase)
VTTDSASAISVELALDVRSGWLARRSLEPLREWMTPQDFEDLRLVVTELVTNAVRHGGREGTLRLLVRCLPRLVEVRVSSSDGATEPVVVYEPQAGGGRLGLRIVDQLAEDWGVDHSTGSTTVWVRLPRAC